MPEYGTPESEEFQEDFKERLRRRMFLCTMVTQKAKEMEDKGKQFDIMDDKHWVHARFADIAQFTIEKLKNPQMKKVFLETF